MKNHIVSRAISCLLTLLLVIGAVPVQAETVSGGTIDGLEYNIYDGKVTITDYTGSATELAIPQTIEGYPVTSIGDNAFYYCESLNTIELPAGLIYLGESAFENCSSLTEINIPDTITELDDCLFRDCTSLSQVTIPDSVTSIGYETFFSCGNLTDIVIPDSVTHIALFAFAGCDSLKNIEFSSNLSYIGESAFEYCSSLTEITIPDKVTVIDVSAFSFCSSLAQVTIPSSVERIGGYAFSYCPNLTDLYYTGTIEQWNKTTGVNDESFTSLTIHFNHNTQDTTEPETTAPTESAPTLPNTGNSGTEYLLGDTNGNGKVNVKDATDIQKSIADFVTLDNMQKLAADVDQNGNVNIKDATAIQKYLADIETGYDIGQILNNGTNGNVGDFSPLAGKWVFEYEKQYINERKILVVCAFDFSQSGFTFLGLGDASVENEYDNDYYEYKGKTYVALSSSGEYVEYEEKDNMVTVLYTASYDCPKIYFERTAEDTLKVVGIDEEFPCSEALVVGTEIKADI